MLLLYSPHGLSWRTFCDGDTLIILDEVYSSIPRSPNFYLQLLSPISLGDGWDYPMCEVKPTVEILIDRLGVKHFIWGTDMPIVMRFYTYRQTLEHIRICLSNLNRTEVDLVTGGNMARIMKLASQKNTDS